MNPDRIPGYDLTFGAPKSFSLIYETLLAQGKTEQAAELLRVFENSVALAMSEVEKNAQAQVNEPNGKHYSRTTGNIVWAGFTHYQARPVDGVADPFVHMHAYVFNMTEDRIEGKWKALDMYQTMVDRVYYQAVFFQSLAAGMQDLGYAIERQGVSFELEGIARETIDKFSRRTQEIQKHAEDLGVTSAAGKRNMAVVTRAGKDEGLSPEETRQVFRDRQNDEERPLIERLAEGHNGGPRMQQGPSAHEAIDHAIAHWFERKSAVGTRRLYATAIMHALESGLTLSDIEKAAREHPSLLFGADRFGNAVVTTREVRAEERFLREFVEHQTVPSFAELGAAKGVGEHAPSRDWLSDEQKRVVAHVMDSTDRVIGIRGGAGTGKTTAMQETVEAIEAATGKKVVVVAPTTTASHDTLRESGFEQADTLAKLLVDKDLQKQAKGGIIYVDEAGLIGAPTMRRLFELSANVGARVILQGDTRQHVSVERGDALRYLEQHAGLRFAELTEIRRQEHPGYRAAVESFAKGDVTEGYEKLDELGWVREIKDGSMHETLVRDYLDTLDKAPKNAERHKVALIVTPPHEEIATVNGLVREGLRERGKLGPERELERLVPVTWTEAERQEPHRYRDPERDGNLVVEFTQNATGFTRGERFTVKGILDGEVILAAADGSARVLPLEESARFQVYTTQALPVAVGDVVRVTQGGKDLDGARMNTNARYVVQGFDDEGRVLLGTKTLKNTFAGPPAGVVSRRLDGTSALHLAHGYAVTSHASQSATVDYVFASQSTKTFLATTREGAYVTESRGRKACYVYTDDKDGLVAAAERSSARMFASDVQEERREPAKAPGTPPKASAPKGLAAAWDAIRARAASLLRKAWGQREEDNSIALNFAAKQRVAYATAAAQRQPAQKAPAKTVFGKYTRLVQQPKAPDIGHER